MVLHRKGGMVTTDTRSHSLTDTHTLYSQYPNSTLVSVLDSTQPYSDLTLDKLLHEEIRLKVYGH